LDKVEGHLNQGDVVSDWLGIRVYEPERREDGEVVWHHKRSPPANLTNILTIGIYEGHAFVIKDIAASSIAIRDSHKQTAFNATSKGVRKEKR